MMALFLFGDITHYHVSVAQIVGKTGILLRPSVEKREMRVLLEPFTGGDLSSWTNLDIAKVAGKDTKR